MKPLRAALAAVVAVAVGGAAVRFAGVLSLAVALGGVYGAAVWFTAENWDILTDRDGAWQSSRWSGGFTAFVLFAALFGVTRSVVTSTEATFALQVLVVGVGWLGLLLGIAMTRDRYQP
jgi:hypothetical protein